MVKKTIEARIDEDARNSHTLLDDGLGRQSTTTGYVTRYCRSRILSVLYLVKR